MQLCEPRSFQHRYRINFESGITVQSVRVANCWCISKHRLNCLEYSQIQLWPGRRTHTQTQINTHAHTYTHTRTYAHTHTRIHTHTHAQKIQKASEGT